MSSAIAINQFTVVKPMTGEITENRRLTAEARGPKSDVRHITIRYKDTYTYVPGQSAGIIPPGTDPRTGKPNKLRLYSIASERRGDRGDSRSVSLCIVRHYWDNKETGEKDIPGACSNYMCDLKPGDQVNVTGPSGRHFILPENFKDRDLIFVATGTGIAPYRGMLKEMFDAGYQGNVSLYFGTAYNDTVLYDDEFQAYAEKHENFTYIKAISREGEPNPIPDLVPTRQNKMYVQVQMYVHREALKAVFAKPNSMIYLCGLKGMEEGIFPILEKLGGELGVKESFVAKLKAEQRLRVEVY